MSMQRNMHFRQVPLLLADLLVKICFLCAFCTKIVYAHQNASLAAKNATKLHPVYQFPPNTVLSGITSRGNGQLLITATDQNAVHIFSPDTGEMQHIVFPEIEKIFCVARMTNDSLGLLGVGKSDDVEYSKVNGIWEVNLIGDVNIASTHRKISALPDIGHEVKFNDLAFLPGMGGIGPDFNTSAGTFYLSVSALDVNTTISSFSLLENRFSLNAVLPDSLYDVIRGCPGEGVFGLFASPRNSLFFSNNIKALTGDTNIRLGGDQFGVAYEVAQYRPGIGSDPSCHPVQFLKFAVDEEDVQWITTGRANVLLRADFLGRISIAAGQLGSDILPNPIGAAFSGVSTSLERTLYIATGGAIRSDGGQEGGQIFALSDLEH